MTTELKTKVTDASVTRFLNEIADESQRTDCRTVVDMMRKATGKEPRMWGSSIVGFDSYHYVGKSGREGDWFLAGVSPRKQALTLYVLGGWEKDPELLKQLGKHSLGVGCLYIKRLADIKIPALTKLIQQSVQQARKLAEAEKKKQSKRR